ncbi:MAG TPA: hypothetical protein PLZ51_18770, partial [Aggregatilineales bacterium]|nr:hypothetical protein [Aggregatilineales bacterium]
VGTGECAIVLFNRDLNVTRNISNNGDLSLPAQCTGTFYDVLPDNGVGNATGWTVSGSNITVNGVLPLTSVLLVKPMDNPNTPPVIANFPPSDLIFSGAGISIPTNGSALLSATVIAINGANIGTGEQVNFTILSGGGALTGSSATTNGSGSASVTYNAPASPTTALIEASITAHDGKVYRGVYTVHVGLGNGATMMNASSRFLTIGPELAGAVDILGVQATKYGNTDVALSVATFSENPHAGPLDATLKSPVVQVNLGSTTAISAVEVAVKYTDTGSEGSYALWWWTGSGWSVINGTQSNPIDDMITFVVTSTTTPSLSDLVGGAEFFVNIATEFTLDLSGTTMLQVGDEQPILIQIDNTLIDDPLTSAGFTLNLPSGMRIATFDNATNGCGGTLTADPLTTFITLAGATVSANDSCNISVNLEATAGGLQQFNAQLLATLDGQPISVNANTIALQVAFEVTMTEQELLYHLQMNNTPNGWNYILTDFVTPNLLKIAVVINGESGIIELTINPAVTTAMMRWTVSNITNTTGGATSATYADLARQHIMTAFAYAIDDYSRAVVETTAYDILDFVVLSDGLSIDVVGLLP